MKATAPMDDSGMNSRPHAFFLHSGAYSSFVLSARRGDENIMAPMEEGNLWGSDCVQLTEYAVFFSVGSDTINQALWVYLDAEGKTDPPERNLSAAFTSRGEQVYLESLDDMTYGDHCDQFFLPEGEYEVRLLAWNLAQADDNFDADPKLFLKYAHHELHFLSSANNLAIKRTVHGDDMDEHASPP